jgi:hypothetical protein
MRERFSDGEWNDLLVLPFHLFAAVAIADGKIQPAELKEFLTRTTQGALGYKDQLHKEVARGIVDGDSGELLKAGTGQTGWDPGAVKAMMKEKLTSGEYQGFIGSMFIDLLNIAKASKKKKKGWFRKKEEDLGEDEQQRLAAIGMFWDLDLSTLEGFKS